MQTITGGEQIQFTIYIRDESGDFYDPDTLSIDIRRNAIDVLAGPFVYGESDRITRVSSGVYVFIFVPSRNTQPGVYTLRSLSITLDEPRTDFDYFEIHEPLPEASLTLDAPRIYGVLRESYDYTTLFQGLTDTICLVGHADGLPRNTPIEVKDIRHIISMMYADPDSPLLRALLEAYNGGARDIIVVAAAAMNEYLPKQEDRFTPFDEWGDNTFYQQYYNRLNTAYDILSEYDTYDIIVPVEAPYYNSGDVDFLGQLADHCLNTFSRTSKPVMGLIGTRTVGQTDEDIENMISDSRLTAVDDDDVSVFQNTGKFVTIIAGEGSFNHPQLPFMYNSSLAVSAAANLAQTPLNMGLTYSPLKRVSSLASKHPTEEQILAMTRARINPVIKTKRGRRGGQFEIVVSADNTMSPESSDYWSIATIRLVCSTIDTIRRIGNVKIGQVGYGTLKSEIDDYLLGLVTNRLIKDYTLNINKDPSDFNKAIIDVSMNPYTQLREVTFQTLVGVNE